MALLFRSYKKETGLSWSVMLMGWYYGNQELFLILYFSKHLSSNSKIMPVLKMGNQFGDGRCLKSALEVTDG